MVSLCCATGAVVKTYDLTSESMRLSCTMGALDAEVTCARYNHNGKILASCSVDGGISLDVAASGELLSRFFCPAKTLAERRLNAVQFSSGSRFLVTGGGDGVVRIWDLKTQEVSQSFHVGASPVSSVTFCGFKDDFIVAGNEAGAITVCDVQVPESMGFLTADPKFPAAQVTNIAASPHPYARQMLGSTYGDGSVRVWDLHTGQLTAEFPQQHDSAASSLAISPVSKVLLATGGLDRRVLFFDTMQRKELRSMDFSNPVSALALCADGKTLAVGTTSGEILVFDLRGAITPLFSIAAHETAPVNALHFASPIADAASALQSAAVLPQGQPVISTDRSGASMQEIVNRKLEAMGLALDSSVLTSPTGASRVEPLQEDGINAFVERLLTRLDALVDDNARLRRENASLHALLRQQAASFDGSSQSAPLQRELSALWRQTVSPPMTEPLAPR
ncbi:hypothetical protein P43SY_002841 [Pythium insidiosum]|uniref:Anaphase-promoting complex subunit 4 WD40 domain-containing protein n=1 Tax=Pythium insidiosum TaxID=114742 RepID=A0AAD5MIF0_PYTIN|nr:hypothetical protein P43SY_002841 [Pythium insidiosum]